MLCGQRFLLKLVLTKLYHPFYYDSGTVQNVEQQYVPRSLISQNTGSSRVFFCDSQNIAAIKGSRVSSTSASYNSIWVKIVKSCPFAKYPKKFPYVTPSNYIPEDPVCSLFLLHSHFFGKNVAHVLLLTLVKEHVGFMWKGFITKHEMLTRMPYIYIIYLQEQRFRTFVWTLSQFAWLHEKF